MRLPLAILLLGTALGAAPSEARSRRIAVSAPAGQMEAWIELAVRADRDARKLIGTEVAPQHTLHIQVGERHEVADPLHLSFSGREYRTLILQRLCAAFICRAMFPKDRTPPFLPSAEWMAEALASRLHAATEGGADRTRSDYGPIRAGLAVGSMPLVERLVTRPVPPSSPILYRLHALHCELLTDCIQSVHSPDETLCHKILDLESHGRSTKEAVEFILHPFFDEGENLQTWYERMARDAVRDRFEPSPVDDIARRLLECTTVSSISMNQGADRIARMPIEDLPEKLADYRMDRDAVQRAYKQVFDLVQEAPVLLREPLMAHMNALGLLSKGKSRAFVRAMHAARRDFAEAVRRQRAVEALLDRMQGEYSLPTEQLAPYLHVVKRADEQAMALDPALQKLLDANDE